MEHTLLQRNNSEVYFRVLDELHVQRSFQSHSCCQYVILQTSMRMACLQNKSKRSVFCSIKALCCFYHAGMKCPVHSVHALMASALL